jgi:hypothetical protein
MTPENRNSGARRDASYYATARKTHSRGKECTCNNKKPLDAVFSMRSLPRSTFKL